MISSKSPALWRKPLWRFWAGEKRSRDEGNQTVAVLRRISPEKKKRKVFKNVLHHPHRDSISELKGHAASDPGTHLGKDDERSTEKRPGSPAPVRHPGSVSCQRGRRSRRANCS